MALASETEGWQQEGLKVSFSTAAVNGCPKAVFLWTETELKAGKAEGWNPVFSG